MNETINALEAENARLADALAVKDEQVTGLLAEIGRLRSRNAVLETELKPVITCDVLNWHGENPWKPEGCDILNSIGHRVATTNAPDCATGIANCHNAVLKAKELGKMSAQEIPNSVGIAVRNIRKFIDENIDSMGRDVLRRTIHKMLDDVCDSADDEMNCFEKRMLVQKEILADTAQRNVRVENENAELRECIRKNCDANDSIKRVLEGLVRIVFEYKTFGEDKNHEFTEQTYDDALRLSQELMSR